MFFNIRLSRLQTCNEVGTQIKSSLSFFTNSAIKFQINRKKKRQNLRKHMKRKKKQRPYQFV